MLEANPGLEQIIFNFLSQKDYVGEREGLSKKVSFDTSLQKVIFRCISLFYFFSLLHFLAGC